MELASLIIIGFAAVSAIVAGSIKITTIILADQTIRKDKVFASLISMPIAAVIILNVPQDIISKTFWLVMAAAETWIRCQLGRCFERCNRAGRFCGVRRPARRCDRYFVQF